MTLEQVNEERARYGKEPLTELPKKSDEKPESKKEDPKPDPKKEEKVEDKTPQPEVELDDNKILEALKKRGYNVNSLEELKPKDPAPDPEKVAEEREAAKLTYGLQKGLFKKKDYENYISESKDPIGSVYSDYHTMAKKQDPNLTDQEILEEFNEEYGLNAEKDSRKHLRGQRDLALRSEKILQEKYGKIFSLDSEFSTHETAQKAEQERRQKVLTQTPIVKKHIEEAFNKLRKLKWQADKDESYDIEIPELTITTGMAEFLKPELVEKFVLDDWDAEKIYSAAENLVTKTAFQNIIKNAADQYLNKHAAGSRGIPQMGKEKKQTEDKPVLSEKQQIMYDEMMAEKEGRKVPNPVAN